MIFNKWKTKFEKYLKKIYVDLINILINWEMATKSRHFAGTFQIIFRDMQFP